MATNLVAGDTNGFSDVFVRDATTMERVSVSNAGAQLPHSGGSRDAAISDDGSDVGFTHVGAGVTADDGSTNLTKTYVRRRGATPATELVSRGAAVAEGKSVGISGDGTAFAFASGTDALSSEEDDSRDQHVYLRRTRPPRRTPATRDERGIGLAVYQRGRSARRLPHDRRPGRRHEQRA